MIRALAHLGLGSNVGDRRASIEEGLARLSAPPELEILAVSGLVETAATGPVEQGPFLNAAAAVRTTLSPRALLARCLDVEVALGRPASGPARAGPRTLDIDVLLYGDRIIAEPGLIVPHPRMHDRWFVLAPLGEIAPDARHPVLDLTVAGMLERLPMSYHSS